MNAGENGESRSRFTRAALRGAKVTVMGLGREGLALARFLAGHGANVLVTDQQDEAALAGRLDALRALPLRYSLGGHPDGALDADVIFVSPGIARTTPFLQEAGRRGVRLSSETELFFDLCPARITAITGSSGKTTTTTLVGKMLEAAGRPTWVGGNIGQPLLGEIERIQPADDVVLELSSFQLEHLRVSPQIGAILNVTPNHLDRHASMEAYTRAKWQIVAHQQPGDLAIFGVDDAGARQLAEDHARDYPHQGRALFSGLEWVQRGCCLREDRLVWARAEGQQDICRLSEIRLRGWHNVLNMLAACTIAGEAGATVGAMRQVALSFAGVAHRLELVAELGGVVYVNDSIATSPERSMAALRAFAEPIILLAGGRDKHLPWDEWADLALQRAHHVVLFGEASDLIQRALEAAFARAGGDGMLTPASVHHAGGFDQAVRLAARLARRGDVALLSPGGTSFDGFVDFAQRGERFRQLVQELAVSQEKQP